MTIRFGLGVGVTAGVAGGGAGVVPAATIPVLLLILFDL